VDRDDPRWACPFWALGCLDPADLRGRTPLRIELILTPDTVQRPEERSTNPAQLSCGGVIFHPAQNDADRTGISMLVGPIRNGLTYLIKLQKDRVESATAVSDQSGTFRDYESSDSFFPS
jgi:hypothetical protein